MALAAAVCLGLATPTGAAAAPVPTPSSERPTGTSTSTWVPKALPIIEITEGSDGGTVNGSDGLDTFAGDTGYHAVLWRKGKLVDLGPGIAFDVNRRGTAVGAIYDEQHRGRAGLWRRNTPVPLAVPPGAVSSSAQSINEHGTIVGFAYFPVADETPQARALVWSAQTPNQYQDIGSLASQNGEETRLYGIGEAGVFVGNSELSSSWRSQAITGTAVTGLRDLDDGGDDVQSRAHAIAGRFIAGAVTPPGTGSSRPALWKDGVLRKLPLPPGGDYGELTAVNIRGTAVGYTDQGGALWPLGQGLVFLTGLDGIWTGSPQTITDRNVVGGSSINSDGVYMPTLWVQR
ncbi:MAG: hypothetical protein QG608_2935 [Actinomycetota bacterium]|nr:hypothetical protein [Actinomycetota bacterium]